MCAEYVVLRNAFTVVVHDSEVGLGVGVTLLGGQAEPPDGFRLVLRHASTVAVRNPEGELCVCVTLFSRVPCRFVTPGHGLA